MKIRATILLGIVLSSKTKVCVVTFKIYSMNDVINVRMKALMFLLVTSNSMAREVTRERPLKSDTDLLVSDDQQRQNEKKRGRKTRKTIETLMEKKQP